MTDSRQPAPGRLGLVQRFVNSVDLESGEDAFADPMHARAWLAAAGLAVGPAPLAVDDVARLVAVREALRSLALANNGDPVDPGAVAVLAGAARRADVRVSVHPDGTTALGPASTGVDAVAGALLAAVHDARRDGTWDRLKACREEQCRWAFYDRSRNRSSSWCVMSVCGNRAKARAFRERKRGR